jgi:hypothetical protein
MLKPSSTPTGTCVNKPRGGIDGADKGRKANRSELATDGSKDPVFLGHAQRMRNAVQFTASQHLVSEDVRSLLLRNRLD